MTVRGDYRRLIVKIERTVMENVTGGDVRSFWDCSARF